MRDEDQEFIHDLANKLTMIDGKVDRLQNKATEEFVLKELENLKAYCLEANQLLRVYKDTLRKRIDN